MVTLHALLINRVHLRSERRVPIKDAVECWVFFLNEYTADLVKIRSIVPLDHTNAEMAHTKAKEMSPRSILT